MSSSSQKAKETEPPIDPSVLADPEVEDELESGSDDEAEAESSNQANTPSTAGSKKKKKRSKVAKALSALRGKGKDAIPDKAVDVVLEKLREQGGEAAAVADRETVRAALEQMKLAEVAKGEVAIGGKNRKDTGGHKFWGTQPVQQFGEGPPEQEGPIEPSLPREQVRQEPYPLPKEFVWATLDIMDPNELKELYELLSAYYIEDSDATFRFQYSAEFLRWALSPPGYHKEWHVGLRVASTKKLVAFISAIPLHIRVRENQFEASEVNFLCIHRKLRSKRLTPVLIKEVTRQCHLKGVFQALYTVGAVLPTPVSSCRYYHRSLNITKLVSVRFVTVNSSSTVARMIRQYKVPDRPKLLEHGLREMEERDLPQVTDLYARYMARFTMYAPMSEDDLRHQLLSGLGVGPRTKESWRTPRDGQVIWTYVIEDPATHKVTDFFSFFSLPSTIIGHEQYNLLNAAYLYYYATETVFQPEAEESGALKKRLEELIADALIIADKSKFDVFNALTLMDNMQFIEDMKFGRGDGLLNYYLYNWRAAPLAGVSAVDGVKAGKGVGVVMV